MHRLRLDRRLEPAVQLVVERPGAVHRRDVLRDAREVDRAGRRGPERGRELRRQVAPRRRARCTGTTRPATIAFDDLASSSAAAVAGRPARARPRGGGSRPGAGAAPGPARCRARRRSAARAAWYTSSASACRPARYSASISCSQRRSRSGCSRDERLELADDVAVAAELEVGVDPLLDRDEAQLLEPADLRLRQVVERELGERRAAPERERADEQRAALVRRSLRASASSCSNRCASIWSGETAARIRAHASRGRPAPAPCGARRPSSAATPSPSSAARRPRARRRADPSGRPGPGEGARAASNARWRGPPSAIGPFSSVASSGPSIRNPAFDGVCTTKRRRPSQFAARRRDSRSRS